MGVDLASIGLSMDSRPVVEGTKALDALADSATKVEPKIDGVTKAVDGLGTSSANVWRRGSDTAKVIDALGESANRTGQKFVVSNGQMADTAKILQAQADQAKLAAQANVALGGSTAQLTLGQQQLIEKFREQAATIGMSRSQLMAYQAAQMGVTEQTKDAVAAVKAHEDALKAANKAKEDARNQSNQLTDALKLLAAGYAALKIGEYVKDSAMMAARYETLGIVMGVVGKTAGYTKTQMDVAADSIARQGITMLESRNSAVKLVQAHVDLANAAGLARIAQDAAVIGNINSSEAFERLVNGISRGNVLILRNIGINVNLQSAYQQMADSLGKSTKELTENERVQARLNAVIDRGSDIAGTYEAAMGTAGKQILSMQRYIDDLKVKAGETFNEVLTVAVMGMTSALKDANGEVSELSKNNQLAEWGHNIAAVFVGIANAVGNTVTAMEKVSTYAAHQVAQQAIEDKYKQQFKDDNKDRGFFDMGKSPNADRIAAARAAELAEENVAYVTAQATLSGNFDRFDKAFNERTATQLAKRQSDAAAKLKVDQDYLAQSKAVMQAYAGYSVEIQQAAQKALATGIYQGTPTYRDTEGRPQKEKVDQADNTRLQNHLARIKDQEEVDKAYAEMSMRLDDQRHAAGEIGDDQYFKNRKDNLATIYAAEQAMYGDELTALRAHHNSTDAEREKNQKSIDDILGKQDASRRKYEADSIVADDAERIRKNAVATAGQDAMNKYLSSLDQEASKLEAANRGHEDSKGAVERETVAQLDLAIAYQNQFMAQQAANGATKEELEQSPLILKYLEDQRAAHERIAKALDQADVDKASKTAADEAARDWKRTANTIENDLTNAILDGGGRGWKKLVRDMEVAFAKMVLQPILQPISGGLASIAYPGAPQAALSGGGVGSMMTGVSNAYSMISGGMTLSGGLGSGFMGSLAGGLQGAGIGSGLTSSAGLALGNGIADVVGTSVAGAMSSGLAAMAAAAPYVAAIVGAVALVKTLDHSGTPHIGGAASASSAGVSTIRAEDLHFEKTQTSPDAEKMTAQLASGIVGILDSTALAFGKTAGYTAATAFADDSSKDGAWGGLVISKLGQTLVDWQSTRGNGPWAPKVFADGAEGQQQYLAAVSSDVRTALDGIGLPDWAQKMLDGLGKDASLDDMAKVVDSINATQKALKTMGDTLVGFSSLSEGAVSALMAASGGIQNLAAGASAYYDGFYSDAEKSASAIKQVGDVLAAVGLAMPDTNEGFRALVEQQMALGEAAAPAQAALFSVAGAFAKLHPLVQATTTAIEDQAAAQAAAMQAVRDNAGTLMTGVDGAFSALQSVVAREKAALQTRIDAETALVAKYQSLSDALHNALDAGSTMDRASAQAQIKTALTIAKAGGPLPDADSLKQALGVIGKDASSLFATYQDYQRDFYSTQNDIGDLAKLSDGALTVEEKSLKSLQDQSQALDNVLIDAQEQINILKGISTNGLTLIQAVEGLRSAILGAMSNPLNSATSAINAEYQKALGRAPDPGGQQWWLDKIAQGVPLPAVLGAIDTSREAQIQGLYQSLFNRTADAGGRDFFMNSGASISEIQSAMMNSDEYKKKLGIPGFAAGGDFGGGLRIVGENGPELESTGPSRITNSQAFLSRLSNPSDNSSALSAAVDRLTATVEKQQKTIANLESAMQGTQRNTKKFTDSMERLTQGWKSVPTTAAV